MKPELETLEAERDGLNREIENFTDEVERLEARLAAADRLAEAVDNTLGLWPGGDEEAHALTAALSEYRDDPKVGEIRGFIVNVDCPIHGAPAVASVSDVKTNVEEDASHE